LGRGQSAAERQCGQARHGCSQNSSLHCFVSLVLLTCFFVA
jgi:hypothetical protein